MTTTNMDTIPVAPLKIMTLDGFRPLAEKINSLIVKARHDQAWEYKNLPAFIGYEADTYLVNANAPGLTPVKQKGLSGNLFTAPIYLFWPI